MFNENKNTDENNTKRGVNVRSDIKKEKRIERT